MFLSRLSRCGALLGLLSATGVFAQNTTATNTTGSAVTNSTTVLILGGGMTGIIAARTLYEQGVNDFILLDGKIELGGRMIGKAFGVTGKQVFVEYGPGVIQGTQVGNGTANPVWQLAVKHNLSTVPLDLYGSITTYDDTGYNNYTDVFYQSVDNFAQSVALAGQQLEESSVDVSLRTAYNILGVYPQTPQEAASDYYLNDFSASETSWFASAWKYNFTYVPESGGFSDDRLMSIDPRGIVYIAQAEADEFLQPQQLILNQTVSLIEYGDEGVTVSTAGGLTISADYVLCTFSVGVLQHNDVQFQPPLPYWKVESISSLQMATYTKIYLQFNDSFWFPTQMGLYADKQKGKYPVWQSLDHVGFFPGSGIIFVTVTGDWSIYIEQLTAEQAQAEIVEVLRVMYPNTTIPDPVDFHVSVWADDALYRGSFVTWGPSYTPGHSQNLGATLNNRLWFAGEATSVTNFGTLTGAYAEGETVGATLAACVKGNTTSCNTYNVNQTTVPKVAPYQKFLTPPASS